MDHTTCKAPQLYEQVYNIQAFTVNTRASVFLSSVCILIVAGQLGGAAPCRWSRCRRIAEQPRKVPLLIKAGATHGELSACFCTEVHKLDAIAGLPSSARRYIGATGITATVFRSRPGGLRRGMCARCAHFAGQPGGPRSVVAAHPICTSKWRATLRRGRSSKLYFKWRATLRRGRVLGATDATAARPSITPFGCGRRPPQVDGQQLPGSGLLERVRLPGGC